MFASQSLGNSQEEAMNFDVWMDFGITHRFHQFPKFGLRFKNQGTSTRDCRKQRKNNLNTLMRIMIDFYVIYLRKTKYHGVTAVMRVLTDMFIRWCACWFLVLNHCSGLVSRETCSKCCKGQRSRHFMNHCQHVDTSISHINLISSWSVNSCTWHLQMSLNFRLYTSPSLWLSSKWTSTCKRCSNLWCPHKGG